MLDPHPGLPGNHRSRYLNQLPRLLRRHCSYAAQDRWLKDQLVIGAVVTLRIEQDVVYVDSQGMGDALADVDGPLRCKSDVELAFPLGCEYPQVSEHGVGEGDYLEGGFERLCLGSEEIVGIAVGPGEGTPVQSAAGVLRVRHYLVGDLDLSAEKVHILAVISEDGKNWLTLVENLVPGEDGELIVHDLDSVAVVEVRGAEHQHVTELVFARHADVGNPAARYCGGDQFSYEMLLGEIEEFALFRHGSKDTTEGAVWAIKNPMGKRRSNHGGTKGG